MITSNDSYLDLLKKFPPRPIYTDAELQRTQTIIDELLDKQNLSPEEQDYLNVLGTLIFEYEQSRVEIPDIYGIELLKELMNEFELRQKDLISIFKTESIISNILHGKRQLTVRHIQELAKYFNVSPAVFFPN